LEKMRHNGQLPDGTRVEIDGSISAIENFPRLNILTNNSWKSVPLSPAENGFVSLTKNDLAVLLWQSDMTKQELRAMMDGQFSRPTEELSQTDLVQAWLPGTPPGELVKNFLADVDLSKKGLTSRQKGKAGHAAAVKLLSLEQIHQHINTIRREDFDPRTYDSKGYVLLGSFQTDGHRLLLRAYKLKELLSVRYKRYNKDLLPNPLQSTVGGVDYYLTEVRNVVKTPQDVKDLLGCWPHEVREKVNVLGIDLGQAFVVGASAVRPNPPVQKRTKRGKRGGNKKRPSKKKKKRHKRKTADKGKAVAQGDKGDERPAFYNLAVNQKAVLQPMLKFRRWMELKKDEKLHGLEDLAALEAEGEVADQATQQNGTQTTLGTIKSISDIESSLPPLRGQNADFTLYRQYGDQYWEHLNHFYNGGQRFKRFKWFARRAKEEEYKRVTDSLLRMVDGSLGAKRNADNKVIIGIGLGKFSSNNKLSSLHTSFESYFVQR
ncbi:hypothetical protein BGW42_007533, partial [Actinomortierella wolfii]